MVSPRARSCFRWAARVAVVHTVLVSVAIPVRVGYWHSFGYTAGRIQRLVDFFADPLVHRTANTLSPLVRWTQETTQIGIGKVVLVYETLLFVVCGGITYFLVACSGRHLYLWWVDRKRSS